MKSLTKSIWPALACVLLGMCIVFVGRSFSQDAGNFKDLQFATTNSTLKFFDPNSGYLYVYSTDSGVLVNVWVVEKLGEKLERHYPNRMIYREN
jgi:hypothetical protein